MNEKQAAESPPADRRVVLFSGLICVLALALRLPGVFTDFWLDEIWNWSLAQQIRTPAEIFTGIHFDANHWLNTFYLYLCGDRGAWFVYRLPALVAGVLTVPVAIRVARQDGRLESCAAGLLAATSYLMTVYSSEARGYALLVLFALLSFALLRRRLEEPRVDVTVLFWLTSVLGFLSHLTFLFPYGAFVAASAVGFTRKRRNWRRAARDMVACHAVPCLFFLGLYLTDVRHIRYGGADTGPLMVTIQEAAALALGLPASGPLALVALAGVFALLGWEARQLWRPNPELAVFYVSVLCVVPGAVIMVASRGYSCWTVRYFLVCVPFLLLLFARRLGRLWRTDGTGRAFAVALLTVFVVGNLARIARFVEHGRGRYLEAVSFMFRQTAGATITVGSDHHFRNKALLTFYARYQPPERRIEYCDKDHWPAGGPEWFLAHSLAADYSPQPALVVADETSNRHYRYEFVRHFPYSGMSGWHWALYRKSRRPPQPQPEPESQPGGDSPHRNEAAQQQ